jgi:hypothetical protein
MVAGNFFELQSVKHLCHQKIFQFPRCSFVEFAPPALNEVAERALAISPLALQFATCFYLSNTVCS